MSNEDDLIITFNSGDEDDDEDCEDYRNIYNSNTTLFDKKLHKKPLLNQSSNDERSPIRSSSPESPAIVDDLKDSKKPLLVKSKSHKPKKRKHNKAKETGAIKVYKRRWFMLFLFSMNTMINGILFMGLSPISNIVAPYFGVTSVLVEWLSNMFMLVYIFVALPSAYLMSKWGIRPIIVVAATLDASATAFHYAGFHSKGFHFVIIGQLFAAISFGTIIQIPGKLSSTWFPESERATATSIAVFMNILGVALGFLQPTHMVINSKDHAVVQSGIRWLFLSQLIACITILLLTFLFYREEPPSPPSGISHNTEDPAFMQTLLMLGKNIYFIVMSQAYAIYYALYVTISVLLNPIITAKFKKGYVEKLGWMGFSCDSAAILSCFLIGLWLDRSHGYQACAILLNVSSMIVWGSFMLIYVMTDNFYALFFMIVLLGFVGIPYFASGIEQAAEMTFPVPEGTSSAVLLTLGNLYGFILILVLGGLIENGHEVIAGYVIFGLYVTSSICAAFSKTKQNRKNAEDFAETLVTTKLKQSLGHGWVDVKLAKTEF